MDQLESRALARRESVPGHPDWKFGEGSPSSPEDAPIDAEFQIVRVDPVDSRKGGGQAGQSSDPPPPPPSDVPTSSVPPYKKSGKFASLVVFLALVGLAVIGVLLLTNDFNKNTLSNGHVGKVLTAVASILVGTIIVMMVRLSFFRKQRRDLEPPSQKRLEHIKGRMSRTKEWIQDNRDKPLMYPVYFIGAWWLAVWTAFIFRERPVSPWNFLDKNWGLTWISPLLVLVAIYFILVSSKVIKTMGWATVAIIGIVWLGAIFSGTGFGDAGGVKPTGPSLHSLRPGESSTYIVTTSRWETFIFPIGERVEYTALGPAKLRRKTTEGITEHFDLVDNVRIPSATRRDGSPAQVREIALKAIDEPTEVKIKVSGAQVQTSDPQESNNNSNIVFEGG